MITPCIKQCKLSNNICISCKRTLTQIQNWSQYSEKQRIKIISSLNKMDNNMNTYTVDFSLLDDIKFYAQNAIELARLSKDEYDKKINWNNLEIRNDSVEFFVNITGEIGHRIELSGCSQKCTNLHEFIEEYIYSELKVPVEVLSEY